MMNNKIINNDVLMVNNLPRGSIASIHLMVLCLGHDSIFLPKDVQPKLLLNNECMVRLPALCVAHQTRFHGI